MSAATRSPDADRRPRRPIAAGRRAADTACKVVCTLFTALGVFVLGWILLLLVWRGVSALSPQLFLLPTPAPNSPGGLANAILGSFVMTMLAIAVATPVGVLAGTWLAEYGRGSRLASVIRFTNDVLLSAPSILIGLFVYVLLVRSFGGYSGWAGAVALAIIATPVIVRTTEDLMRLVPGALREAAVALGAPLSVAIRQVIWRASTAGIVTGVLLATARVAGETAPLLFTALNHSNWFSANLTGPVANLPVTIYQFALSPFENWQQLGWAGAFLITVGVLTLSVAARLFLRARGRS